VVSALERVETDLASIGRGTIVSNERTSPGVHNSIPATQAHMVMLCWDVPFIEYFRGLHPAESRLYEPFNRRGSALRHVGNNKYIDIAHI
jgi:hypothetical protein